MKKLSFLVFLFYLYTPFSYSQPYIEMMSDTNANFFEIQKAFNDYWADRNPNVKGKGYKQFKRWENFWAPRVSPTGEIPRNTFYEGFLESQRQAAAHGNSPQPGVAMSSSAAATTSGPWVPIGPNVSTRTVWNTLRGIGRVNIVTFHPSNTNTMFVGTPAGGIWKTTDGGQNWTSNTDFMPRLGVSDIAIHPTNHNTMFWATGDADGFDTFANGIFRSTNGGTSWTQTAFPTNVVAISRLLIQPNNGNNMFASTSSGIYRSTNGGTSWTLVQTGNFSSMEFKPNSYNTLYAVTRDNGQFWRSTNNGASWSQITSGIPSSGTRRGKIAVSPNNNNYVYVMFCDPNGSFYGIYRSTNSGASFSERHRCTTPSSSSPNLLGWNADGSDYGGQGWYDLALAVNPNNANDVWVGGVNVWQSTNGGSSWANRSSWVAFGSDNYLHADIHELEFSPHDNTLYACSDGGFGKRSGSAWEDLSDDLEITQFYSIGVAESIPDNVIGGAQDNGTLHNRDDYTSADDWVTLLGGDGMQCIINPTNSDIMYGEAQNGRIRKTTNGGTNWIDISPDTDGAWETPYELQPNTPSRMLAGYKKLYLSTNGGDTWTALNSTSGLLNGSNTREIEMTTNNNIFYFSFNDRLYRTTNGGSSWTYLTNGLPTQATITDIHVSTSNTNHVWVTYGGTWQAGNKAFYSSDGGASFSNITHNLPNTQVNCITVDLTNNNTYIGTDLGVYVREGSNNSWSNHNLSSLPNVIVKDLEINEAKNFLYAGTFGRGVWKLDIAENTTPTADFKAEPTEVCANQSVQFTDESIGNPTSWSWDFGDGNTSTAQNPSHTYTTSGTYTVKLTATNSTGNDTETKTDYITIHPASGSQTLNITACEQYDYNNVSYTSSGTYTIVDPGGCFTTTLNLTIETTPIAIYTTASACATYTWSQNNQTYTTSGFYEHIEAIPNSSCSQAHWLDLFIIEETVEDVTACTSYEINGTTQTTNGTYYEIISNPLCTTKTVNLTIIQPPNTITQNVTECDSYTWPINGQTYTQSGTHSHTVGGGASNGCDQDYVLNLTINSSDDIYTDITACAPYIWATNNQSYSQSGTYSTVLTDGNGCEYTSYLNLNIVPNNTTQQSTVVECFDYTWPVNGQTYTTTGTYTFVQNLGSGCIINYSLNLTILNGSQNLTFNETATGSYTWLGNIYYCSGTYTQSFTQNGCTFNGTLNLTINNSVYSVENKTECDSYFWDLNQNTYTSSGYYTHPFVIDGCNSNKALDLIINNSTTSINNETADDSYTWNGVTYYCSGTYSVTLTNSVGCDSTASLNLNLNNGW